MKKVKEELECGPATDPDLKRIMAPATAEEIAEAKQLKATMLNRIAGQHNFGSDAEALRFRELQAEADAWQATFEHLLKAFDAGNVLVISLEARKSYARTLARLGEYDRALQLAEEIGKEIETFRAAVERPDDEHCLCVRGKHPKYVNTELVYSPRRQKMVQMQKCSICGFYRSAG